MPAPIIKVENVGKNFIIGHQSNERYTALRDVIANSVKSTWKKTVDLVKGNYYVEGGIAEEFWALRDINFSIEPGERVGIIGRNGAGKSTLLKILSRITEPTKGRITIRGRVASLLEVGTGFHPELTGRENIYLNGAILGMARSEIRKNFDAIVEFAEVEKFLDTPVKRYSSGMYVRLAFAVAAHLEPEILIVDEVLAVGDAQFQKKCLGKMQDVSKNEGRTVLFVSHNMQAIQDLCNKGILLNKGELVAEGPINRIIETYVNNNSLNSAVYTFKPVDTIKAFVSSLKISDLDNNLNSEIPFGKPWKIDIDFEVNEPVKELVLGLGMLTIFGTPVRTVWQKPLDLPNGRYRATFIEDSILFASGMYKLLIGLTERGQSLQYIDNNIIFNISNAIWENPVNAIDTTNGILLNTMKMNVSNA
jgi:lipopolysaccharide transport system ATP-binding protein